MLAGGLIAGLSVPAYAQSEAALKDSFEGNVMPLRMAPALAAPTEVERALGQPDKSSERSEGSLKVVTSIYTHDDQRITAEFVEGVLIRYSISSR